MTTGNTSTFMTRSDKYAIGDIIMSVGVYDLILAYTDNDPVRTYKVVNAATDVAELETKVFATAVFGIRELDKYMRNGFKADNPLAELAEIFRKEDIDNTMLN